LLTSLLKNGSNINIFLLGANNNVVKKAAEKIANNYPNINIVVKTNKTIFLLKFNFIILISLLIF